MKEQIREGEELLGKEDKYVLAIKQQYTEALARLREFKEAAQVGS